MRPTSRSLQIILASVMAFAAVASLFAGGASAQGSSNSDLNHPSYYQALGYGTCDKIDSPSTPYTLPSAPSGSYWTLLVLKAGSEESNDDWNTLVPNPTPGAYSHPSGKDLSHVIRCWKPNTSSSTTSTPGSSTTSTTTSTIPGGTCDDYTPTQVAVNPSTAAPADNITITGVAYPGDTVTAKFETSPGNFVTLGSAVAGPTGQFTINAIVPSAPNGNYNIVVSSTLCPTSTTITIFVAGPVFSGCGSNNAGRTLAQGQTFFWALHVPSFDTTKPVQMRIYRAGSTYTLYNGVWPGSNQLSLTIPAAAPVGQYTMEQVGTGTNGKTKTKTCPIWVVLNSQGSSASVPISSTGGGTSPMATLPIAALLALGAFTLVRLRIRPARQ